MSPSQCRAARALLRLEQAELAKTAQIAVSTLIDFEAERRTPRKATVAAIRAALEGAGITFIDSNGGGPGVRLRSAD